MGCHAANKSVENGGKWQQRKPCGPGKALCPVEIQNRLQEYQETTETLEQQLVKMEDDVKIIQTEIQAVHNESEHLKQHQTENIILCTTPKCPPPVAPQSPAPIPCPPCPAMECCKHHLKQTREKYDTLLDDFQRRLVEIGILKIDNDKVTQDLKDAEEAKKAAEDEVKELQRRLNDYKSEFGANASEGLSELEKELELAKSRLRNSKDQLKNFQRFDEAQQSQIRDYMDKHNISEELAKEQKTQIDILEQDANRITEQVSDEIEKLKEEFKENLEEFKPLADELREVQLGIQEAEKLYVVALSKNEQLTNDVQLIKEQVGAATEELENLRLNSTMGEGEKEDLLQEIEGLKKQIEDLEIESAQLIDDLEKMTEAAEEAERTAQEKLQEIAQLTTDMEAVREGSARKVTRTKDLCDMTRQFLHDIITDLEEHLVVSRGQACRAQKDRDEIRARMQTQVDCLRENSLAAQMRIGNLQAQITYLEKSYKNMYPEPENPDDDPCFCGVTL